MKTKSSDKSGCFPKVIPKKIKNIKIFKGKKQRVEVDRALTSNYHKSLNLALEAASDLVT